SKFNISSVSADQPEVLSKPFQEEIIQLNFVVMQSLEIIEALLNVVNDGIKIDAGKKTMMNAIGGDGEGENDCLLSEL
ncbi:MAG: hypothetical protein EZS28_035814, partial [Streblomastix strix]